MSIEAKKQALLDLPMSVQLQKSLYETARLVSTHYSTQIESNRLTLKEAEDVIKKGKHFPDRKRDEKEVLGYYKALDEISSFVSKKTKITENVIKKLHLNNASLSGSKLPASMRRWLSITGA